MTVTSFLAGGPEEDVFVGRQAELARIGEAMARVRQGEPWLITVEGESGVGKTALIRHWVASLADVRVLWARADQADRIWITASSNSS